MPIRPPNQDDQDIHEVYKEGEGFAQRSKLIEQERQQSGDLEESSDPVRNDRPFKITYPP